VTLATLGFLCGSSVICYLGQVRVPRSFLALVVPLGYLLLILASWSLRRWIQALRSRGEGSYEILCVGSRDRIEHLVDLFEDSRFAGLRVVAACVPAGQSRAPIRGCIPVAGDIDDAAAVAGELDVDVVASTASSHGTPEFLRDLGWQLEGSGRRLMLAPGILNVAGPRVSVVPVAGVPLVWVDEPEFGTGSRLVKRTIDLLGSSLCLLVAAPLMLLVAASIKASSPGPVFYRQARAGLHGEPFRIWKFRSMYVDADASRLSLDEVNESTGHLFKIREDPRVTPVGRLIRRWSIDELPQLFNVIVGQMSLVGPRPLPVGDSNYTGHSRRRLLTLPGITGLWQVSGRSETTWDEAVAHDLYYVDNWSLSLDLVILARTVLTILRGTGAY
jgi:exopolysaccharide biosynthesis polyprenyl glycosylphosphotransferase